MSNGKQATIHLYGDANSAKSAIMRALVYLFPKIGRYTPDGGTFPFNGNINEKKNFAR